MTEHNVEKTLGWNEPIHLKNFKLEPNENLEGKTLRAIIESATHGRDDLKLCSECHHREEAQGDYGLNVLKYTKSNIPDPWLYFGTQGARPWAGSNGWAERFIANPTKPESIKTLLKAWARGGFETK